MFYIVHILSHRLSTGEKLALQSKLGGKITLADKKCLASFTRHHRSFQMKIILNLEIEKHIESPPLSSVVIPQQVEHMKS